MTVVVDDKYFTSLPLQEDDATSITWEGKVNNQPPPTAVAAADTAKATWKDSRHGNLNSWYRS